MIEYKDNHLEKSYSEDYHRVSEEIRNTTL